MVNTCWGRQYERIMEWTSHQDSKVILGEVAEVTLAQPLSKTLNGGQNAAEETKRCLLPAHISNYCQRETGKLQPPPLLLSMQRYPSHLILPCASEQDPMPWLSHSDPIKATWPRSSVNASVSLGQPSKMAHGAHPRRLFSECP